MRLYILGTLAFSFLLYGDIYAGSSHMDEVRSHLDQANKLFCETTTHEMEQWVKWFRNLARQDKQNAKQWLKDKIDHC